jgi:hypothetical protein
LSLDPLEERTLLSSVQAVHPLFDLAVATPRPDPAALTKSPFPSDRFTVADPTQNTGLRVNLPSPDQATNPSDYQDTQVLNTLDGFNLQPRLSIPFDGPIDVNSVTSEEDVPARARDVFLVSLGDTLPGGDKGGEVVGINQTVWDPGTKTLHVESDQLLDQHTRYALIVTDGVRDATGQPIQASDDFTRFRHDLNFGQTKDPVLKAYRKDLLDALAAARQVGVPESDIVVASVFTTQSATAVLEKIRDQIHAATPAPADFDIGSKGEHTVFNLNQVTGISLRQQTGTSTYTSASGNLNMLRDVIPGAVGQIAYGKYVSPDYEVHPGQFIPAVGTRTGTPAVRGTNTIYFTLYLPSGPEPEGGWPVMIWGHGGGSNKDGTYGLPPVAAVMAANGIATIGINAVGSGFGPLSTLTVNPNTPNVVTFPAGGRGFDQDGNGTIGSSEGFGTSVTSDQAIISTRDGRIQTAADLMQLVRVIEVGVDVDGNGVGDLDPARVYYAGPSAGTWYGAPFLAVEPDVRGGVLNSLGPGESERRLGFNRAASGGVLSAATFLASRTPSLLNSPGIISLDGFSVTAGPYFNENMPLRDGVPLKVTVRQPAPGGGTIDVDRVIQSPVTNDVPGAMAIQEAFDNWDWVTQPGNPVAYAPYLRKDPLPGVPTKSILVQFAKGDQYLVNPTATAFLRAGDLADRATYYRYDLAFPGQPTNVPPAPGVAGYPHTFAGLITDLNPTIKAVALAAQQQMATFFASDGTDTIQPPGVPVAYFEVPIQGPLPEGLNYSGSTPAGAPTQVAGNQASVTIPTVAASDMLTATSVPAGNPPLPTVRATSRSTGAARAVPQAARAVLVPQAGPSAMPTAPLIDLAIDAQPPLGWLDSTLDDLAAGLLRHARRRR